MLNHCEKAPQHAPKSRKTSTKSTANRYFKPVFAFTRLPAELAFMVVDHLSAADTTHLAMTCKNFYAAFRALGIKKDVQSGRASSAKWACKSGTTEVLRLALQAGCSPMQRVNFEGFSLNNYRGHVLPLPMLCISSPEDRTAQLKELLTAGLRIHSKTLRKHLDRYKPASILNRARHPNMVAFLLAIGFQKDINAELRQSQDGTIDRRSPTGVIFSATADGAGKDVLTVLLDAGADPDKVPSGFRMTALALSLRREDDDTARLLISRGATLNPATSEMILLNAWDEKETRRLLSIFIPVGLGINDQCSVKGYTRLGAVLQDGYPAGVVQAYLDWGADPRRAYRRLDRANADKPPLTPLQNIFCGQLGSGHKDIGAKLVKLRIAKAKILLAAEGSSVPQPPPGYKSMLDWIVITAPMDALEIAVRTLEPWMELMNSDNSTVLALDRRLSLHQSAPLYINRDGIYIMGDPSVEEMKLIIKRVASFLRQFRAPGFVKHGRPRRHRTQIHAD